MGCIKIHTRDEGERYGGIWRCKGVRMLRKQGLARFVGGRKNGGTNMTFSWDISPCILVEVDRRFRVAYCLHHQGPNAVVEWLTILLRIRGVPGSNLSPGDRLS
jgi:hypothetical protein